MLLSPEERKRLQEYTDRWYAAQDVQVLSQEERRDMDALLEKCLVSIELEELGFSDVQPGGCKEGKEQTCL